MLIGRGHKDYREDFADDASLVDYERCTFCKVPTIAQHAIQLRNSSVSVTEKFKGNLVPRSEVDLGI